MNPKEIAQSVVEKHLVETMLCGVPQAKDFNSTGYYIWDDGHLTIKVKCPINVTGLAGTEFILRADFQEKYYTYFFSFQPEVANV